MTHSVPTRRSSESAPAHVDEQLLEAGPRGLERVFGEQGLLPEGLDGVAQVATVTHALDLQRDVRPRPDPHDQVDEPLADRKSTRLNSSHYSASRMPSSD